MEYTVTHMDGSLIGWARSPRNAETLIEQDSRESGRDKSDYRVDLTWDDDNEDDSRNG